MYKDSVSPRMFASFNLFHGCLFSFALPPACSTMQPSQPPIALLAILCVESFCKACSAAPIFLKARKASSVGFNASSAVFTLLTVPPLLAVIPLAIFASIKNDPGFGLGFEFAVAQHSLWSDVGASGFGSHGS